MSFEVSKEKLEIWADYILNHSLGGIVPEDVVMVKGEKIVWPLLSILQDKIFAAGAVCDLNLVAPDNNRGQVWGGSMAKHGTLEQIKRVPQWHKDRYEAMNKFIEVLGAEDPSLFANLPHETSAEITKADGPYKETRLSKRWVITLYPTQGFADLEGMSLEEYADILVKASTADPGKLEELEKPLADLIEKAKTVRIVTQCPGKEKMLELTMDITDRTPEMCIGNRNFPDGEVFTSPNANTVQGEIFVDLPVSYNGVAIEGVYLKIKDGIIVEYTAQKEQDTLKKIIETDEGSHRLGEVALGMNQGLQIALKHPLLVEKVGGTVHIAIGASYAGPYVKDPNSPEGQKQLEAYEAQGIFNKSSQHVDIVTDFRPGGAGREIYLDDTKLKIKDNMWVIPENN